MTRYISLRKGVSLKVQNRLQLLQQLDTRYSRVTFGRRSLSTESMYPAWEAIGGRMLRERSQIYVKDPFKSATVARNYTGVSSSALSYMRRVICNQKQYCRHERKLGVFRPVI